MKVACRLLVAVLALACGAAQAQQYLPTDIGVALAATPTTNLVSGQPIEVTITVTNYGPGAVSFLELHSSNFVDQFAQFVTNPNECFLFATVVDAVPTAYYYLNWDVANVAGEGTAPFNAGETSTCHLQMALTPSAPESMAFSFGVATYFTDLNPSNDIGTVTLQRAPVAPPAPIPTLSPAMLLLLTGLFAAFSTLPLLRHRSTVPLSLRRIWIRSPAKYQ